jgi:hypothetical protein
MNLVGKIFTFLIFVMCIVFASFALMLHSAHKIWYDEIAKKGGYRDQVDDAKKDAYNAKQAHAVARSQWEKQDDLYKKQIKELAAERDRLDQTVGEAGANIKRLESDKRQLAAAVKLAEDNLENSRVETDALRKRVSAAETERQKVWDSLVKATNDVMTAAARIAQLEKQARDVVDQSNQAKLALQAAGVRPADALKDPPAGASGEVVALRGSDAEIFLGYDDGIREGHRFSVTRPSTGHYIGDIVIYKVPSPNRAVGRPDKPTMRDQIQTHDNVQAIVSKRR